MAGSFWQINSQDSVLSALLVRGCPDGCHAFRVTVAVQTDTVGFVLLW